MCGTFLQNVGNLNLWVVTANLTNISSGPQPGPEGYMGNSVQNWRWTAAVYMANTGKLVEMWRSKAMQYSDF